MDLQSGISGRMVNQIEYLVAYRWIRNHDRIPAAILCRFKRNIFKNGSPIVSGESFRTEITGPFSFPPSDNHHKTNPECLVGEMIFVRGDQSVEDRKAIEGYLAHKWKMSDLLPESHPYAEQDLHIDQNGQITINRTFDYENDASEFSSVQEPQIYPLVQVLPGYIG